MRRILAACALIFTACDPDPCAGGDPSLTLGVGVADVFVPYEDGDPVSVVPAPQGGYGVEIRAQTTGLSTHEPIRMQMLTLHGDEVLGDFTIESQPVYCQPEGYGLVYGAVVGFDSALFPQQGDLLPYNGEIVSLQVVATDADGVQATGTCDVTVQVGS